MVDVLEQTSRALLDRLLKEEGRPGDTAGTTKAGGITRVGSALQAFLRALLLELAAIERVEVNTVLPVVGGRVVPLDKAPAGQLARAIKEVRRTRVLSVRLRSPIEDLQRRPSRIGKLLEVRNDVAHGDAIPKDADAVLRAVRELVAAYRREVGWS